MARRCGTWLVVLVLVVTTGGPWAVLQVCAWAGMLVRYSQEGTLGSALEKTFDGRHPCKLCKLVREGRSQSPPKDEILQVSKLDPFPPSPVSGLPGPDGVGIEVSFRVAGWVPERRSPPPVPPPRRG